MSCCTPTGYRTVFGAGTADRAAGRYRRRGLVGSARWLVDRLAASTVAGRSVLEAGGGIGDLQVELLLAGAGHATNIEIVDTYEDAARTLIAGRCLEGRIERRLGDFALRVDEPPTADIVVMHRVVCCYPDPDALVARACEHSSDRVALTVPRESWWVRLGFAAENAWFRLRRIPFRTYVHPIEPMLDVAAARGFDPIDTHRGALWWSVILVRRRGAPAEGQGGNTW